MDWVYSRACDHFARSLELLAHALYSILFVHFHQNHTSFVLYLMDFQQPNLVLLYQESGFVDVCPVLSQLFLPMQSQLLLFLPGSDCWQAIPGNHLWCNIPHL